MEQRVYLRQILQQATAVDATEANNSGHRRATKADPESNGWKRVPREVDHDPRYRSPTRATRERKWSTLVFQVSDPRYIIEHQLFANDGQSKVGLTEEDRVRKAERVSGRAVGVKRSRRRQSVTVETN